MFETEIIDKLFLELSQFAKAKTHRELETERIFTMSLQAVEEERDKLLAEVERLTEINDDLRECLDAIVLLYNKDRPAPGYFEFKRFWLDKARDLINMWANKA